MEVKYAFFRKKYDNNIRYISKEFEDVIDNISITKSIGFFEYNYNGNTTSITYKISNEKNGTRYLYLSCGDSAFKSAKVLDEIKRKITTSELRKNYFISILRDDVSQYFCEKSYVKFSVFERRMRELVFGILTLDLGSDWYEETIQSDLDEKMKEILRSSNRSKLIQEAMHNMTLSQLESYLFTPYRKVTCEEVVDVILESKDSFKTIDELMIYIESAKPQSLWVRFFQGKVEIDDLNSKLGEMRSYRNIVAHCKEMPYESYTYCIKLLRDLISGIDNAIASLDTSIYKKVSLIETFAVLSETLSEAINSRFDGVFASFEKLAKEFAKIEFPKYKFDFPDTFYKSFELPTVDTNLNMLNFDPEATDKDSDIDEEENESDEDS